MIHQEKSIKQNEDIWNPVFINVFVINILTHLCTYMMNVLSAKYADHLGATATIVGLVSGLFALTALLFKVISAPAIDSYNRKHVLILSIGILLASFVGYVFSNTISMLIISRLLTGAGLAFSTTVCLTVASDSLPNDKMSTGIGYFSLGTAICMAISPYVGLKLAEAVGYRWTFLICAIIIVLTIAYAMTMKIEHKKAKVFSIRLSNIIAQEALTPAILLFILAISMSVVSAFLVLFAEKQGVRSNIGYYFTVNAVTMIFTRPLIGRLADRYGTTRIVIPSMLFAALSFFIISVSDSLPLFLLAGVVSAFGFGGSQPAIIAVSMKSVPKERRGAASCTSYVGMDLGNLVGPVLAGAIIEVWGYTAMWQIMTIPIFAVIALSFAFKSMIDNMGKTLSPGNA